MHVAIVHDAFMQWGGAENLVLAMSEIWPNAPIYTSAVNANILPAGFPKEKLITSFIQKFPLSKKIYQPLFFLQPLAFEQFNLNEFDVVISSTTKFAKSIITGPRTLHICYCNTPTRILWFFKEYIRQRDLSFFLKPIYAPLLTPVISSLRAHDYSAAQRVDYFVANSKNVARRIKKFYRRDSTVIYPFVDFKKFKPDINSKRQTAGDKYYLIVSRLTGHKRVDIAIEAFNHLGLPLKIIGAGSEEKKYRRMAKSNIQLLGWVDGKQLAQYYQNCQALIYPQEEDFGITALEAQAAGRPVIAYKAGGALETVIDGKTGVFFEPQTSQALIEAIKRFESLKFSSKDCIKNARNFSKQRFKKELKKFVEEKWDQACLTSTL
ncbi:hypothetical protein B5M47_03550 [candidate division CPR3 bacterium 4484_211]|uniref:Glycosyl transferase family 1 domain-containing protein n=1 Tax=candidate division CPR3 bacterium 4484_211 TaxID=1968527 RepID=A0A1W9NYR7_UNCC3|nr:MAG: hypothetical protein B5M47_03550 [candidate division CPR3 bacterium 4484_211]